MVFGFGKAKLSDEDTKGCLRKCRTSITAFQGCVRANGGVPGPCESLLNATMYCLAERQCPEEAKVYKKCVFKVHANSTQQGRLRIYDDTHACDEQIEAMRKALARIGAYPELVHGVAKTP